MAPVPFSLRMKQSTTRSARVYKRPARRLYSGNIAATPTSGSDFSRCPPFRWQLLQDTFPGARCGTSPGVLVKILKPQMMSLDSFESSSEGSVIGLRGNSHAVIIVVVAEISGFFALGEGAGAPPREHAATVIRNESNRNEFA